LQEVSDGSTTFSWSVLSTVAYQRRRGRVQISKQDPAVGHDRRGRLDH
jgi:hypothetical protein